jgi:hypothetical protein
MSPEETIKQLQQKIELYEQNGPAKLYYSLNRKMNEMGDLLNKTNLSGVDLESKDSKEFDRLFKLLEKSQVISNAAQAVKEFAGITGDEKKDVERKPFLDTLAEERK